MLKTDLDKLRWTKKADEPILIKELDLHGSNRGWLVIDSLGSGRAVGGVRMGVGVTLDEVRELAAEMTLKFSFLNLPTGGAKAGIRTPSPVSGREREALFLGLGEALEPLLRAGVYLPGTDMGTYPRDLDNLLRGAGMREKKQGATLDSGYYTAVSVFSAVEAALAFLGIPMSGARIGIQGLGKVGRRLVQLASEVGLRVAAVSTRMGAVYSAQGLDAERLVDLAERKGDEVVLNYEEGRAIEREELFEQDLEILCPCAGLYPVHPGNVDRIGAKLLVSGCNVTATSEVEDRLFARGITYLPGFVCNSGGVLCYILADYGLSEEEIRTFIGSGIRRKVTSLLTRAEERGESPRALAHRIVKQNQERFACESEAKAKGKTRLARIRYRNAGTMEMIRTAVWPLVRSGLPGPRSIRRGLARKIVFDRLFQR